MGHYFTRIVVCCVLFIISGAGTLSGDTFAKTNDFTSVEELKNKMNSADLTMTEFRRLVIMVGKRDTSNDHAYLLGLLNDERLNGRAKEVVLSTITTTSIRDNGNYRDALIGNFPKLIGAEKPGSPVLPALVHLAIYLKIEDALIEFALNGLRDVSEPLNAYGTDIFLSTSEENVKIIAEKVRRLVTQNLKDRMSLMLQNDSHSNILPHIEALGLLDSRGSALQDQFLIRLLDSEWVTESERIAILHYLQRIPDYSRRYGAWLLLPATLVRILNDPNTSEGERLEVVKLAGETGLLEIRDYLVDLTFQEDPNGKLGLEAQAALYKLPDRRSAIMLGRYQLFAEKKCEAHLMPSFTRGHVRSQIFPTEGVNAKHEFTRLPFDLPDHPLDWH